MNLKDIKIKVCKLEDRIDKCCDEEHGTGAVTSVNEEVGDVILEADDIDTSNDIPVSTNQGQYKIGDIVLKGQNIETIIKNMLNETLMPYISTPASMTGGFSVASLMEVGTQLVATFIVSKNLGVIKSRDTHSDTSVKGGTGINTFIGSGITSAGGINTVIVRGYNTWAASALFLEGVTPYYNSNGGAENNLDSARNAETLSKNVTTKGLYPYLYGMSVENYSASTYNLYSVLEKRIANKGDQSFLMSGVDKIIYILIPLESEFNNGELSSIKDGNGFEMLDAANSAFDKEEVSVLSQGLFSNHTTQYMMYKYNRGYTTANQLYTIKF